MFNPLNFIFKKRISSVIGIDIGTSSIKVAELRRDEGERFQLLNYASMDMTRVDAGESFRGLSFDLRDEDLAQHLAFLRKQGGLSSDSVVMSLPVFSTFVTVMNMPLLEEKELASAVPLQAREYIPIPLSEVVLDWKVIRTMKKADLTTAELPPNGEGLAPGAGIGIETTTKKNAPHHEVLLMAAPREMVQKYVRIAQLANFTLLGLEIESFALARAAVTDPQSPALLLDIGAFSSSIAVFDDGFLRLVHNIGISSADLTRACARALGTTMERAEKQKLSFGLYASGGETEIVTAYLPLLEALSRDIERVVSAYWRSNGRQISRVVLSGTTALLKGLDQYLASRLRMPVALVDPFTHVALPRDIAAISPIIAPQFANAVGLGMKEI